MALDAFEIRQGSHHDFPDLGEGQFGIYLIGPVADPGCRYPMVHWRKGRPGAEREVLEASLASTAEWCVWLKETGDGGGTWESLGSQLNTLEIPGPSPMASPPPQAEGDALAEEVNLGDLPFPAPSLPGRLRAPAPGSSPAGIPGAGLPVQAPAWAGHGAEPARLSQGQGARPTFPAAGQRLPRADVPPPFAHAGWRAGVEPGQPRRRQQDRPAGKGPFRGIHPGKPGEMLLPAGGAAAIGPDGALQHPLGGLCCAGSLDRVPRAPGRGGRPAGASSGQPVRGSRGRSRRFGYDRSGTFRCAQGRVRSASVLINDAVPPFRVPAAGLAGREPREARGRWGPWLRFGPAYALPGLAARGTPATSAAWSSPTRGNWTGTCGRSTGTRNGCFAMRPAAPGPSRITKACWPTAGASTALTVRSPSAPHRRAGRAAEEPRFLRPGRRQGRAAWQPRDARKTHLGAETVHPGADPGRPGAEPQGLHP